MKLRNKKVVVMGLGLLEGGVGVAKWLANKGAKVLVTDLKEKEELKKSIEKLKPFDIKYVLGRHRAKDFKKADLIVKNPAVPKNSKFLKIARKNNIPIETEISIFFKLCPGKIIGVTGTKGKSTVATLIYKFLREKTNNVILGGNIRKETLPQLKKLNKESLAVLEVSSWQLASLKKHKISPQGGVITNIKEDHLNRYSSLKEYINDKSVIFQYQKPSNYLVLNYDNEITRSFSKKAKSQVYFYSLKSPTAITYLKRGTIFFNKKKIAKKEDIKLIGKHNLSNVLAAITVAGIEKVKKEKIKKVLRSFSGLEGRLEFVRKINNVSFYNDTCATNPAATESALNSINKGIILIAGGSEKGLSFKELSKTIVRRVKALILLKGEGSNRLEKEVRKTLKEEDKSLPIKRVGEMEEAVELAFKLAKPGEVVLLSPACASFSQFKNEFDRGNQFIKAVKEL